MLLRIAISIILCAFVAIGTFRSVLLQIIDSSYDEKLKFYIEYPLIALILTSATFGIIYDRYFKYRCRADPPMMCKCTKGLHGKVVVITGATSGIGYEVALECAKQGATVIFGARNLETGKAIEKDLCRRANTIHVLCLHLDLEHLESCVEFAKKVRDRHPRVAYLINNAAIFNMPSDSTIDGFERTWQTNYLGAVVVTENLREYVSHGMFGTSGIIFLSSGSVKYIRSEEIMDTNQFTNIPNLFELKDLLRHYAKTKHALWLYATNLAHVRTKQDPSISVLSVDPGYTWTGIYRRCFLGSISGLYTRFICSFVMRDPEEGAQTVMHCMNAPSVLNGSCMKDCSVVSKPNKIDINNSVVLVTKTLSILAKFVPPTIIYTKNLN